MIASLNCYTTFLSPDHVAPQQHTLQVGQQQQVWQQDCITELTPKRQPSPKRIGTVLAENRFRDREEDARKKESL